MCFSNRRSVLAETSDPRARLAIRGNGAQELSILLRTNCPASAADIDYLKVNIGRRAKVGNSFTQLPVLLGRQGH